MSNERYCLDEDGWIRKDGKVLSMSEVVNQLNSLESYRKAKQKEVKKLRCISDLQSDVITGVESYVRLKEVWY